jgi:hypothetical protein
MNSPEERRQAELEAGQRAQERYRRLDYIQRLKKTDRVTSAVRMAPKGAAITSPESVIHVAFYVDGVEVWTGPSALADDPPDDLMAQLALWQNVHGVSLPDPTVVGKAIDEGMRRYHEDLRRRNKGRPDFERPRR